ERGVITHLASNGSTVIHDYELARWGGTSEDVEAGLADGTFGMAEETGREMNEAIRRGAREGRGLGEALADALDARRDLAHPELSLLLAARRLGIGFTVHAALGAEIIHQHPAADGAAIGQTSYADFRRLVAHLPRLEGGVVLNLGSAVLMPEVFLKALTVCRNLNDGCPREFVAADFDMMRHYRPRVNVVERPTRTGGGRGYQITGHHELMVPLVAWAVVEALERSRWADDVAPMNAGPARSVRAGPGSCGRRCSALAARFSPARRLARADRALPPDRDAQQLAVAQVERVEEAA